LLYTAQIGLELLDSSNPWVSALYTWLYIWGFVIVGFVTTEELAE
jgi:hypothetical protein